MGLRPETRTRIERWIGFYNKSKNDDGKVPCLNLSNEAIAISDGGIDELVELLQDVDCIPKADLQGNHIQDKDIPKLLTLPFGELSLYSNGIRLEGVKLLANSDIKRLDLRSNYMGKEAGEYLAEHARQLVLFLDRQTGISEECRARITQRTQSNWPKTEKETTQTSEQEEASRSNGGRMFAPEELHKKMKALVIAKNTEPAANGENGHAPNGNNGVHCTR